MTFLRKLILAGFLFGFLFSCSTYNGNTRNRTTKPIFKSTENKTVKNSETKTEISEITTEIPDNLGQNPNINPEKNTVKSTIPKETIKPKIQVNLPEVNREFRAAWIASVANINWPSKRTLTTEQQKAEAIQILNTLKENNFNAVILQVRPSADALYASELEPWSNFLTGENGKAPSPYYDPLEFWIEEAHKRGMELHAWLNPYRAHHTNGGRITSTSMVNQKPKEVIRLQNGMHWFDPSMKSVQDHTSAVVMDIVKRYDVDGIHFDDYFYPYASYNNGADFPDNVSWNQYKNSGGQLSRADWRRENVNLFIKRIYEEIKTEKNWVKFGISPFGIWKPGFPSGVSGLSQYDELYADAKLWLNEGWIDYFTPQLYWPVDAPRQNFSSLLNWWESENTFKRHLWPGLNTVEIKAADKPREIIRQIDITRKLVPNSAGVAHWSMAGLNYGMLNSLKSGPYSEKALIPKSPWLKPLVNSKPTLNLEVDYAYITAAWDCNCTQNSNIKHWLLYMKYGDTWITEILDAQVSSKEIEKNKNGQNLNLIVIQSVDRLGNESEYEVKEII